MEQNKAMQLKKYDHVWLRVTPDVDPYAVPAEKNAEVRAAAGQEQFLEKMARELSDREYYLTLARRGGAGSRVFRELAAEEERHARALRAMWFLLTGELAPRQVSGKVRVPDNKREALRERYREECLSAEEYAAMAATAQGDAAETLRAMAKEERGHATRIRRLLEELL